MSARLSLFKGFQNTSELNLRRKNLSIQELVYRQALADFAYDLRISFAAVLKNQLTAKLLEDIHIRRKNNLELVKLRYEAGREDRGAYLRSEADYLQAQYEIRSEGRLMIISRSELAKHIGADFYDVADVTGTFDVPGIPERPSKELLLSNPGYLIAKYRAEASAYELKSRYGSLYPDISLSGSVSRAGDAWPPEEESWSAGVSLSYPFFSGGRDIYGIKSAQLNRRMAENSFINTERDIALRLEKAHSDVIDALESYEVRKKYHAARKERSEIARVKYINGLISYQDWDSIENEFISVQKSLLDAKYNVFAAWARWFRLLGEEG